MPIIGPGAPVPYDVGIPLYTGEAMRWNPLPPPPWDKVPESLHYAMPAIYAGFLLGRLVKAIDKGVGLLTFGKLRFYPLPEDAAPPRLPD